MAAEVIKKAMSWWDPCACFRRRDAIFSALRRCARFLSLSSVGPFYLLRRYLDQLGMASKYNTKAYCRQTLIGGNYGLLDTETFIPNPDYYSALLWHQLMGKGVLTIDINWLLMINLSKSTSFRVTIRNDRNVDLVEGDAQKDGSLLRRLKRSVLWVGRQASTESQRREEYHLTAENGAHLSRMMLLNGKPLQVTEEGDIPELWPMLVAANAPINISPLSIAFVVLPNFEAGACVPHDQ